MKRFLFLTICAAFSFARAASAQDAAKTENTLKVMTFNLRYAGPNSPNSWAARRPVMKAYWQQENADIIGTQEGLYEQLKDIGADNPAYSIIGTGRDGGSRGEWAAIFYRTSRFEPLEFDHFWLSDTPDKIGSTTWGHANRRMVTWVKFRDRQTHREFHFWNTHFDHEVQLAREKSAALIMERIQNVPLATPVLLVGDFNAAARQNTTYDLLTTGENAFSDTWFAAKKRIGPDVGTFHAYREPVPNGAHIDWILSRGPVTTHSTQVTTFAQNGQYPSDHFPVVATVSIGETQQK